MTIHERKIRMNRLHDFFLRLRVKPDWLLRYPTAIIAVIAGLATISMKLSELTGPASAFGMTSLARTATFALFFVVMYFAIVRIMRFSISDVPKTRDGDDSDA